MQNSSKSKLDQANVTLFPPLDDDGGCLPAHVAEKFHRITKRRRSPSLVIYDDEEEETRQLALETAVSVHNEIQHMQNSIAELERLLRRPAETDEDELVKLNGKARRNHGGNGVGEISIVKSESSMESDPSSVGSVSSDD